MGRDAVRGRRAQAGNDSQRRRADWLVQEESRLLQMPASHLVRRNPEDLDRQAAKIQAAGNGEGDVRRGEGDVRRVLHVSSRHRFFMSPAKTCMPGTSRALTTVPPR